MDAKTLRSRLQDLGWTGGELAVRTESHPNTVSTWLTGRISVPGPVAAVVELESSAQILLADIKPLPRMQKSRRGKQTKAQPRRR